MGPSRNRGRPFWTFAPPSEKVWNGKSRRTAIYGWCNYRLPIIRMNYWRIRGVCWQVLAFWRSLKPEKLPAIYACQAATAL
jgi:hypothetical protein